MTREQLTTARLACSLVFAIVNVCEQRHGGEPTMNLAQKIEALMVMLTRKHLGELAPAQRQRFAERCLYVANLAAPEEKPVQSCGILVDLGKYRRDE